MKRSPSNPLFTFLTPFFPLSLSLSLPIMRVRFFLARGTRVTRARTRDYTFRISNARNVGHALGKINHHYLMVSWPRARLEKRKRTTGRAASCQKMTGKRNNNSDRSLVLACRCSLARRSRWTARASPTQRFCIVRRIIACVSLLQIKWKTKQPLFWF